MDVSFVWHLGERFTTSSKFIELEGIRLHYVDQGMPTKKTILLLHGVPEWIYAFRYLIPVFIDEGWRVVAFDLPGLGFSESLPKKDYSIRKMMRLTLQFIQQLKLKNVYLFGQDWGALLAMAVAPELLLDLKGVCLCNGYLPVIGQKVPPFFRIWKIFARFSFWINPGVLIGRGTQNGLKAEEVEAYNLPYRGGKKKAAIRWFPNAVPTKEGDGTATLVNDIWRRLKEMDVPFLAFFGEDDWFTSGGAELMSKELKHLLVEEPVKIRGGHFLLEDAPTEVSERIINFVQQN